MGCISKRNLIAILAFFGYGLIDPIQSEFSLEEVIFYKPEIFVIIKIAIVIIFLISYIVASIFVSRHGGAFVLGITMIYMGMIYLLLPWRQKEYGIDIILSFVMAISKKFAYCALPDIWSRWSPPEERFRRVAMTVLGPILSNYMMNSVYYSEMSKVYYSLGILSLIWSVIWLLNVKNDPTNDCSLSSNEKKILIEKSEMIDRERNNLSTYPWGLILTSKPLWVLSITAMILNINNTLSSVVFIGYGSITIILPVYYLVIGFVADRINKKKQISKLYICFGLFMAAVSMIIAQYELLFGQLFRASQILIELAFLVNVIELSPRYSAILFGFFNTFNQIGFLGISWYYNKVEYSYKPGTNLVNFFVVIHVLSALIYYFWGSSELQPWNRTQKEEFELKKQTVERDTRIV